MCSALDGMFLYRRSNKTKKDVKIFIPFNNTEIDQQVFLHDKTYLRRVLMDSQAKRTDRQADRSVSISCSVLFELTGNQKRIHVKQERRTQGKIKI